MQANPEPRSGRVMMPAVNERLRTLLVHPRLPLIAAALAFLLSLPSLAGGWQGDDWIHRAILLDLGDAAGRAPLWDLFKFVDNGPISEGLRESGVLPWWSAPELRMGFLRPVSAATHMLDTWLWPRSAWPQHLQGVLWYALGVGLVAKLLREVLPGPAAGIAALLFAVEDAHAIPAAWIANRNAVVTLVLGAMMLLAHLRWRRDGGAKWGAASVALLVVALLSGESAVGAVAYLVAWQVTLEEGSWGRRLAGMAPALGVVAIWRLIYDHLGYGASGSGLYIDPGADLLVFAGAVLERWPALMLAQWFQVPVDIWGALPPGGQLALTATGAALFIGVAALFAPLIRDRPDARFLALGTSLSLIAPCAAFPMDRLLVFAGIGCLGLLGLALSELPTEGLRRTVLLGLGVVHGPLAALMLTARTAALPLVGALFFGMAESSAPADPAVTDQVFIFINSTDFAAAYTGVIRVVEDVPGRPPPERVAVLCSQLGAPTITRESTNTLVFTRDEGFLAYPLEQLMRSVSLPFSVGDRIETVDFQAEVRTVMPDGRPETVAFHFHEALEHPRYRWLETEATGVVPWTPPPVGETAKLELIVPSL
jgi:hypothetical protein